MLFNSFEFIFCFLPVTLFVYYLLCRFRWINAALASLVLASLVFYSRWDVRYVFLLLASIAFNYSIGKNLEKNPNKKLLGFALACNLLVLTYYKYTTFLLDNFAQAFGLNLAVPVMVLPLGISFFTFTQAAFLVDAYRGQTKVYNLNLLKYSLFVTIFPHLIAGPILYHKDIIPQFSRLRNFIFSANNFNHGLVIFVLGLFKKVIIADNLAPLAAATFGNPYSVTLLEAWTGVLAYTFQIFYDFSGYSEMAIGLGLMFNLRLPINFRSPYGSTSIIDFWRRWHITLSNFLKYYLYIPLGGNRFGEWQRMRNILITMLLGGLWHGANWTFAIWGLLHGVFLVINHLWRKTGFQLPKLLAWGLTFLSVLCGWVFFRAANIPSALAILKSLIGLNGIILPQTFESKLNLLTAYGVKFGTFPVVTPLKLTLVILLAAFLLSIRNADAKLYANLYSPNKAWLVILVVISGLCILSINSPSPFLYFQF